MTDNNALVQELKPCPFCGREATYCPNNHISGMAPLIRCGACAFEIDGFYHDNPIAAWNTRTPAPAPVGGDVVEKMAIAMAPASFDVFDPKVHGSIVNQLATQKMWREKARKAYAALAAMPPKVEAPAADSVRELVEQLRAQGRKIPYPGSYSWLCTKAADMLERLSHPTADAAVAVERERCAGLLDALLDSQELKLLAGEMTAQEVRTVKAVLTNRAAAIRSGGAS